MACSKERVPRGLATVWSCPVLRRLASQPRSQPDGHRPSAADSPFGVESSDTRCLTQAKERLMLRNSQYLEGCATDGPIGEVEDLYFDAPPYDAAVALNR